MFSSAWQKQIDGNFEPLKFEFEIDIGSDIIKWKTKIGGVCFKCQSSGNFEEQTTRPYALEVWDCKQFIPMMMFLKEHEEELKAFMERYEENV